MAEAGDAIFLDRVAPVGIAPHTPEMAIDVLDSGRPMVRLEQPKHLNLWLEAWSEFKAA